MEHYWLSVAAAEDFDEIYDYGIDEFGLEQILGRQNSVKAF